jgi:hypothetical protein
MLHTPKIAVTTERIKYCQVFTSHCLVAASSSGFPLPLGSWTVPILSYQLLTSDYHSSQLTQPTTVSLMLRPAVSRPVCLGIKHPFGAYDQIFISVRNTSDSYVLDSVGRPLWREDGSVFCMFRWPLPAQSFSGPSPLGLANVFYCLRFETSLFVASYDSQGYGGGIRPRLHTGYSNHSCVSLLSAAPQIGRLRLGKKTPPTVSFPVAAVYNNLVAQEFLAVE